MGTKTMKSVLYFYLMFAIFIVNVASLQGVPIFSPWVTELFKQTSEEAEEGK